MAVELPESERCRLEDAVDGARAGLPAARWVAGENLHLTLRFLGEVDDAGCEVLAAALHDASSGCASFTGWLGGGGCFPPKHPARIVWAGLHDRPEGSVRELQRSIAGAAERVLGLRSEGRPFHPHVTLARCRRPWPLTAVRRWEERLPALIGGEFPVRRAALVESHLGRAGARYEVLQAFPLAPSPSPDQSAR